MLVYVRLRPLTHVPPLRGPRWLRWVSTHGVHGLDHSGCRGDIGRLLLQAVGLFVDRLYLDVWFTEGDTAATWKKNTTSGHILGRSQDELLIYWTIPDFKKATKTTTTNICLMLFWSALSRPLFALFLSLSLRWYWCIKQFGGLAASKGNNHEEMRCQKNCTSSWHKCLLRRRRVENEDKHFVAGLSQKRSIKKSTYRNFHAAQGVLRLYHSENHT